MTWFTPEVIDVIIAVVKAIVILLAVVVAGALLSFVERRLLGWWQDRYGPNRVGPFGMFQIAADMLKMFFKEDWTPPFADKVIFTLAGLSVYAVLFAGWASNNKFALLGSLRASAQTVSYEVFMGLALMGIVVQVGSFNMRDIVEYQAQNLWFIIPQFFGFCTFFIAGVAVTHRHPFDQPEAEQELADGYHIEYAGMKWGMFFVGEYIGIILISALLVTLFFGGWHGPFGILPQLAFFWFFLKTAFFIMLFILLRASIPRPRYDQVMDFSWRFCLPLTLINLLVTAAVVLLNTPAGAVQ